MSLYARQMGDGLSELTRLRRENERLRAALFAISNHELRDHEDYEAIQDMATAALNAGTGK